MDIPPLVLEANGFSSFNEMQEKVLEKKWEERSVLVCAPTASGKTITAELSAMDSIINGKRKVIYTCPLRALASEHFNDFKNKYSKKLGVRMALSTGDFDSSSRHLSNYDLVFCTYEKLDSLTRHKAEWLSSVGLLIVDEVHELDSVRGATLEVVITKFRLLNPKSRVLSLSATVPNSRVLAKWLGAQLVESSFRPVALREGTFFNQSFRFSGSEEESLSGLSESLHSIVDDTVFFRKKQALVFVGTRRSAVSSAKKLRKTVEKCLSENEKVFLSRKSGEILGALEQPTEQCVELAGLVKGGVAFHHAGLVQKQRSVVEELFKSNHLKVIAATPTLAVGVNLPAHTVVVSSTYRFGEYGSERIPVREVKQMVGRAGRPKFDSEGRGVILARSEHDSDFLFANYVNGELEDIESKLGLEPVLRAHLLSAIASDFIYDLSSLESFFSKTLYFHQFGKSKEFFLGLTGLLGELEQMGFVESSPQKISATRVGRRVSELYLDPFAAKAIIDSLCESKKAGVFSYLFLLADCGELSPLLAVPRSSQALLWGELEERKGEMLCDPELKVFEDQDFLRKFFTARLLEEWVDEKGSRGVSEEFNALPGILRSKLDRADWLLYSCSELAGLLGLVRHLPSLQKLRRRVKHGVKEELLALCEVRGIGRVRARRLFRAGISGIAELRKVDTQKLSGMIGESTALSVKKQLGVPLEKSARQKP